MTDVKSVENKVVAGTNAAQAHVKEAVASASEHAKTLLDQGRECCHQTTDRIGCAVSDCKDDLCSSKASTKVVVGILAGFAAFGLVHFFYHQLFGNDE